MRTAVVRPFLRPAIVAFVTGAVLGATVVAPRVAHAGGSHNAEPSSDVLAVGDRVVVAGDFCADPPEVDRGPYFLYLVPEGRWFDPGPVPPYAQRVAPLEIQGQDCGSVARAKFTMPQIESGYADFTVCNDPCTTNQIGDLTVFGAWVGQTPYEARLLAKIGALESKVDGLRGKARDRAELKEEAATLTSDLASTRDQLGATRSEADQLTAQLDDQRHRNAELRSKLDGDVLVPSRTAIAIAVAILVLLAALLVALVHRRGGGEQSADPGMAGGARAG